MVWLTNYLVAMLNITHNYYYKNPVNDTGDVVDDKEMQIRLFSPPWPGKRGWASPGKNKKAGIINKQMTTLFSSMNKVFVQIEVFSIILWKNE